MATQSDLDALDKAIGSGALIVKYQDREVRYQTTKDMLAARNFLYNQLNPIGSATQPIRQVRIFTSKGL